MVRWILCILGVWLLFGGVAAVLAADYRSVGWNDFAGGPLSMGRELQRKFS
jgi:hypothetical protein